MEHILWANKKAKEASEEEEKKYLKEALKKELSIEKGRNAPMRVQMRKYYKLRGRKIIPSRSIFSKGLWWLIYGYKLKLKY